MQSETLPWSDAAAHERTAPLVWTHTLVVGSGAAGLNAAVRLRAAGIEDVLIVTEGLRRGTSFNSGSDKQTYYKLSLCGAEPDSPYALAETLWAGGGMHGDLALVEAALSARAFYHLVELGVRFPTDRFGQHVGYKTDHDPRQRGSATGPYTSRDMCRALAERAQELGIPIREARTAVHLLTVADGARRRAAGVVVVTPEGGFEVYGAENVIFAVGGPGGLFRESVYPQDHCGAIGLALLAGAQAQNLPEMQFGLAATRVRWNVSGSYMQAVPRVVSTAADGVSDEREFLADCFSDAGALHSAVFLKGYEWPFDVQKLAGGSSLIDLLVHIECAERGRRVFLDYRRNGAGFEPAALIPAARAHLERSGALADTPLARLQALNPAALGVFTAQGIDLACEALEVAVCAQHNNGGLAGTLWWESANLPHLFPVGEVNGSHGLYRPGGAALNAGQVGGLRAAQAIAARYRDWIVPRAAVREEARGALTSLSTWLDKGRRALRTWAEERAAFQARMSQVGGHVRSLESATAAQPQAWAQWLRLEREGCAWADAEEVPEALRTRHLCFAHAVYLEAIRFGLASGVGSRGSALVRAANGVPIHPRLGDEWRMQPEEPAFREQVLETVASPDGQVTNRWVARRPLPPADAWFETEWTRFLRGDLE
jgi:succinate dehydrogenase/fumarate reductase flavoprotein subunit